MFYIIKQLPLQDTGRNIITDELEDINSHSDIKLGNFNPTCYKATVTITIEVYFSKLNKNSLKQ